MKIEVKHNKPSVNAKPINDLNKGEVGVLLDRETHNPEMTPWVYIGLGEGKRLSLDSNCTPTVSDRFDRSLVRLLNPGEVITLKITA